MNSIICATNAGSDSRIVHIEAFRRAVEESASLEFLHVIGGDDFEAQSDEMRDAIRHEMRWLMHAIVRVAAERAGVSQVQAGVVIREGDPRREIISRLESADAKTLLIGVPREGDASIFHETSFDDFVSEVRALGVRVDLISTALD